MACVVLIEILWVRSIIELTIINFRNGNHQTHAWVGVVALNFSRLPPSAAANILACY